MSQESVEINGVAHIMLRVRCFDECVDFYDALMPELGLQAVHHSGELVYYIGGRTAIAIRRPDPEFADHVHRELAPGIDHLCFRAQNREDIDKLYSVIQRIGAEIVRPPEEGPWAPGYYSLSFRDPEGIRLEVNHVPSTGVFAEGAEFDPAPDFPLEGRRDTEHAEDTGTAWSR